MQVSTSHDAVYAYHVSEENIRKMTMPLSHIGELKITAECADNFTRAFPSIDELLHFENPRSKEIRTLSFRVISKDFKTSVTIRFRRSSIGFDLEADEDVASDLREMLLDAIAGMKAWYNFIYRDSFEVMFLIIVVALSWEFWYAILKGDFLSTISPIGVLTIFSTGAVLALFDKVRRTLFLKSNFLFGQAREQYNHLEKVRWGIVIGPAIAILIRVVFLAFGH